MNCPKCDSDQVRTFSQFNEDIQKWEWFNGCNKCDWVNINLAQTELHKEELKLLKQGRVITPEDDAKLRAGEPVV